MASIRKISGMNQTENGKQKKRRDFLLTLGIGRFSRFFILVVFPGKPFFEIFHSLAEGSANLGKFAGAKENQYQHKDDKQFLYAQPEHIRFL